MARPRKSARLTVWMNGLLAGTWSIDSKGLHRFVYDEQWMRSEHGRPISLSMPLRPGAGYSSTTVQNFFENLLPDSRLIRERIQARFNTATTSAQDLLAEIGRDCVGALTILPDGAEPQGFDRIDGIALSEADIEALLTRVTQDPRHNDADVDFRVSIAGAQEKTALTWSDGQWLRPTGATPTTHILKLPIGIPPSGINLSTSVENEWLCAHVLDAYGVPVALGEIARFGKAKVLSVPRFDRRPSSDGTWLLRLPQEDFAQVFGVDPDTKYEADGGPGIRQILDQLHGSAQARTDREDFFRTQVLFWMLAAIDGHAKNFSVFIEPRGLYRLTPRYDVLSAYPVLGQGTGTLVRQRIRMAMAVWGRNRHYRWHEIRRSHFEHTAAACGLGSSAPRIIDELVERTPEVIARVGSQLPADFPEAVAAPVLEGLTKAAGELARDQPARS